VEGNLFCIVIICRVACVKGRSPVNRDWIERQLAHGERDHVRAAYNYAEHLPERRRMMQEWADYLDELKANNN